MVRCSEFYERWKRHPNFCEKSPATVSRIDHYLAMVEDLESTGIDVALVYKNFPEGVAREVLKITDPKIVESVIVNAAGMIKRGSKVSPADIKAWAGIESIKNNGENRENSLPLGKEDIPETSVKTATRPPEWPRAPAETIREAPIPSRVAVPPSSPRAVTFMVEADRSDMAAIRQMLSRHMVEDEQEAAQTCFEEGLNLIMDRIEAKVQEEAEAAE